MRVINILLCTLVLPFFLTGQELCKGYFAYEEGTTWTMTTFDKKNKKSGSTHFEVLFNEIENGENIITFTYEAMDKDDEKIAGGDITGKCTKNIFTTSFNGLFSETLPQTPDIQVEISGDFIQYPNEMTAGQKLPDANILIESKIENGMNLFKVTNEITNRKVIGREKITTAAGTFDCIKISYDAKIKLILTKTISVVEYLAIGVGIVRSEQYNKKGELAGYSEITKLNKS